ncbi:MAG: glycosyltransferase family 4 protein [Bacillota bacterium]
MDGYPPVWCIRFHGQPGRDPSIRVQRGQPHRARIFYGTHSLEQMPRVYRRGDVVAIPTVSCEGTSLSCLEAMGYGRPVVTSNAGDWPIPRRQSRLCRFRVVPAHPSADK